MGLAFGTLALGLDACDEIGGKDRWCGAARSCSMQFEASRLLDGEMIIVVDSNLRRWQSHEKVWGRYDELGSLHDCLIPDVSASVLALCTCDEPRRLSL